MGDSFPKIKGAVVQAAPVFLDRDATVLKACQFIEQAADLGAQIVAFPECYIPAFPYWYEFYYSGHPLIMHFYKNLFKNAVTVPSTTTDQIGQAAKNCLTPSRKDAKNCITQRRKELHNAKAQSRKDAKNCITQRRQGAKNCITQRRKDAKAQRIYI